MSMLIISLIMLLLLTLPYLSTDFYEVHSLTNYSIILKYIDNFFNLYGNLTPNLQIAFYKMLNKSININYPIINITYNGSLIYENYEYNNYTLRLNEVDYFFNDYGMTIIAYSKLYDNIVNSILNILKTIYIGFILGWMVIKLDEDSKTYALYPLENIMNIIQQISRDPIGSRNMVKISGGKQKKIFKYRTKKKF